MNRIAQLDPTQATGKTRELFDAVEARLGSVPNLFRVFGNSPAALEGYLSFCGALAGGVLTDRVREQIALVVAEINYCEYSLSAHIYLGGMAGLDRTRDRRCAPGLGGRRHTAAILSLARGIAVQRGGSG